ncbi:MAG: Alkaline phosphatase synthesis sensor protein PhoR [Firmicutes bacterium ADurb.Bin182]|nr:MAG: Alkaline phosphatase synthesis sensor protein PhoR [Firmicutes bacterium ADurb.Bin182]
MFKTLFSRMLITYLAVTLSLLMLLGVTAVSIFQNQYISEQETEMRREGEEINRILVEKYIYDEKRPVAIEELRTIARKYNALIQVDLKKSFGVYGTYMDEESGDKWLLIEGADISEIAESVEEDTATEILSGLFKEFTDIPIMTLARPVLNEAGQTIGAILFHVDTSNVNESISRIYMDLLLVSVIAVIMAILMVSYITGRITRPVIDMNNTVKKYTAGFFDARIKAEGSDEVSQLAKSFNAMADELNTLEQARRSFVANVSHELRSPLTSMHGFLEAMQDGTISNEDFPQYLNIVIAENNRMINMVNDLLDLARIESGQFELNTEQFDINELIRRTLITFETRIGEKKLDVKAEFSQDHCFAEADSFKIAQVLRNLIDNAIKFSPEKSALYVKTHCEKNTVYVSIRDFGCGIAPEDIPYIFDRFYKAEKAHTPKRHTGTGLGLSIVKHIIDLHDQQITVDSKLGEGTAFTFTLKKAESQRNYKTLVKQIKK